MLIVYRSQPHRGWQSIEHFVKLAGRLLDADILRLEATRDLSTLDKLGAAFRRRSASDCCLVVCHGPSELATLLMVPGWRKRFRYIAAWVIDSFWTNHIPRILRHARPFDQIYITSPEDAPDWVRLMRTPTSCLPWASDVLHYGSAETDRSCDLIRVGRQPDEWDSDEETAISCASRGLRFLGRPPDAVNPHDGQREMMQALSQGKFTLAFSNRVNPTQYTHPTREYVTARWVDALASGTTVAGIAPRTLIADELFWPGALLELRNTRKEDGLDMIQEAAASWRPERAVENYRNSLMRLDWRWRLAKLAGDFGITAPNLDRELETLKKTVESISEASGSGVHRLSQVQTNEPSMRSLP